ncbi:hypothetical protein Plhal710r2_c006g0024351 [Plasmopara halstedii]
MKGKIIGCQKTLLPLLQEHTASKIEKHDRTEALSSAQEAETAKNATKILVHSGRNTAISSRIGYNC